MTTSLAGLDNLPAEGAQCRLEVMQLAHLPCTRNAQRVPASPKLHTRLLIKTDLTITLHNCGSASEERLYS
jgi:hypothetical protein